MIVIPAKAGIQQFQIIIKALDTGFPSRAVELSPMRRLFTRPSIMKYGKSGMILFPFPSPD